MQDPNNPSDPSVPPQTRLTNPPVAQSKLVKIKVLRPIRLSDGRQVNPVKGKDTIIECSEEDAAEFCDKKADGPYPFFGERYLGDDPAGADRSIARAARA